MPSFSTSLSGLDADSLALSVIANNLANLNTVAYKDMTPVFQDLFYQQAGLSGAGDPIQVGVGTSVGSIPSPFTQGNVNSTGVPTDVAIQGSGFLITQKGGLTSFTRDGNLSLDTSGNLVTDDGGQLMGYPAVNGTISPGQTLSPLTVAEGQISPPKATDNIELSMNLDASATPTASAAGTLTLSGNASDGETLTVGSTTYTFRTALTSPAVANEVLIGATAADSLTNLSAAINGGNGAGTDYSTGTAANTQASATATTATTLTLTALTTGGSGNSVATTSTMAQGAFGASTLSGGADGATFSTPVVVYDSLGNSHILTYTFTKTAPGNWQYQITLPASDVGGSGSPTVVGSGTLVFDGAGILTSPATNVTGLSITGLADGAGTMNLSWNVLGNSGAPTITQVAGPSATSTAQQDGYAAGTLLNFSIGGDGVIHGVFSNGQTVPLGQIALATFPNAEGLTRSGGNTYTASLSSGLPNAGVPGTSGRGTLVGGALEQSNVDIAKEFAQLILAERGYQANSRAITVADQVTQEAINLVR